MFHPEREAHQSQTEEMGRDNGTAASPSAVGRSTTIPHFGRAEAEGVGAAPPGPAGGVTARSRWGTRPLGRWCRQHEVTARSCWTERKVMES